MASLSLLMFWLGGFRQAFENAKQSPLHFPFVDDINNYFVTYIPSLLWDNAPNTLKGFVSLFVAGFVGYWLAGFGKWLARSAQSTMYPQQVFIGQANFLVRMSEKKSLVLIVITSIVLPIIVAIVSAVVMRALGLKP
jgi:hypothetical protein